MNAPARKAARPAAPDPATRTTSTGAAVPLAEALGTAILAAGTGLHLTTVGPDGTPRLWFFKLADGERFLEARDRLRERLADHPGLLAALRDLDDHQAAPAAEEK